MSLYSSPDVLPTGLAADIDGFLYTSEFGGGRVLKIDPMLVVEQFCLDQVNQ